MTLSIPSFPHNYQITTLINLLIRSFLPRLSPALLFWPHMWPFNHVCSQTWCEADSHPKLEQTNQLPCSSPTRKLLHCPPLPIESKLNPLYSVVHPAPTWLTPNLSKLINIIPSFWSLTACKTERKAWGFLPHDPRHKFHICRYTSSQEPSHVWDWSCILCLLQQIDLRLWDTDNIIRAIK